MKNLLFPAVLLLFSLSGYAQVCNPGQAPANATYGFYPEEPLVINCNGALSSKTIVSRISYRTHNIVTGIDSVTYYFNAMYMFEPNAAMLGLTLTTSGTDSIAEYEPYGIWQSIDPSLDEPAVTGCFSFDVTGQTDMFIEAAFGGINGQGLHMLPVAFKYRLAYTEPDISAVYPNGQWMDYFQFGLDTQYVMIQLLTDGCPNDLMAVASTQPHNGLHPNCNGSVDVQVYFGTPPYTYAFSNGVTGNSPSLTGLCNGIYDVTVTDAQNFSTVAQFVISTLGNTTTSPPGILDSIFNPDVSLYYGDPVEWCELDHSTSIDSFGVITAKVFGNGMLMNPPYDMTTADSVLATWAVFQGGYMYETTMTYIDVDVMDFIVEITGYCLNGRAELGSFQLFATVDLNTLVGINETESARIAVYPNPTNAIVHFEAQHYGPYSIMDTMGRTVKRGMAQLGTNSIDLSTIPDGVYLLRLDDTASVARIMKTTR
jgi:hypothetical protein